MQTEEEIKEVMLERAKKEGLAWEVEQVYDDLRGNGMSPQRAAYEALYEWDCL